MDTMELDYTVYDKEYEKIGYGPDRVKRLKNFISKEHRDILINYMHALPVGPTPRPQIEDKIITDILEYYDAKLYNSFIEQYGQYDVYPDPNPILPATIRKYGDTQLELGVHSDGEKPDGTPALRGGFYRNNLSVICYLTDDYDGGEIFLPDYDLNIKPEAGEAVMFPGRYKHGVRKITRGDRYTLVSFYRFDVPDSYVPPLDMEDGSHELELNYYGDKYGQS